MGEVGWYQGIKGYHGNHWLLCYVPTLNPKPTSSRAALVRVCTSPHPPVVQVQVVRGSLRPRRLDEIERALPSDTRSQSWSKCGSKCGPPRLAAAALTPSPTRRLLPGPGNLPVPKIQRLIHIFINQIIYLNFRGLST